MKCSICGDKAVTRIPYAKLLLCKNHFIEFLIKKVERTIKRYGLTSRNSLIVVGVSGGKDSMTLLDVLKELMLKNREFRILAVHIDLGIPGYSNELREVVIKYCNESDIPLLVLDLKELVGASLPELSKRASRPPCSVCGIVKRFLLNAVAIECGADAIATGHNADDICMYALKSFLLQDYISLSKLVPRTKPVKGAVPRIRPLYEVYERETTLYAMLKNVPFVRMQCPYTPKKSLDNQLKELINNLEDLYPSTKIAFLRNLAKNINTIENSAPFIPISTCSVCGLVASGNICAFCRITKRVLGIAMGEQVRNRIRDYCRGILSRISKN